METKASRATVASITTAVLGCALPVIGAVIIGFGAPNGWAALLVLVAGLIVGGAAFSRTRREPLGPHALAAACAIWLVFAFAIWIDDGAESNPTAAQKQLEVGVAVGWAVCGALIWAGAAAASRRASET